MNLFTPDQVETLQSEFPDVHVLQVLERIEERSAEEPVRHPMSFARAWLRREYGEAVSDAPRARGTFRVDGSWWSEAEHPSATETALRELGRLVFRTLTSPHDAVPMIRESPILFDAFREDSLKVMLRLDGNIQPRPGHPPYTLLARIEAAWRCMNASTSAEDWLKRTLVKGWEPAIKAENTPADIAALEASTASIYAEQVEFPDNGSPW